MFEIMRRPSGLLGARFFSDFDRFFDGFLEPLRSTTAQLSLPSADIYSEDDRSMVVEIQAPGFDRDDIEINVSNGMLEIRGERSEREEHKDRKRSYMLRENSTSFYRSIALPEGANTEDISAELNQGLLKVTVPVERAETKRVEIAAPKTKKAKLTSKAEAR